MDPAVPARLSVDRKIGVVRDLVEDYAAEAAAPPRNGAIAAVEDLYGVEGLPL